tara:strand:- start:3 stop:521 length:519 start_codon:yes stop_codon:yes gene_type:complete
MHEINLYELDKDVIRVPADDVLTGSYSKGLVVRYNRRKMIVDADICKQRFFDNARSTITTSASKGSQKVTNFYLDKPIWNGGDYQIGIATFRLRTNSLKVFCNYVNQSGNKLWEGGYLVTQKFAKQFPVKKFGALEYYQIPLSELRECQDTQKKSVKPQEKYIAFRWKPVEE